MGEWAVEGELSGMLEGLSELTFEDIDIVGNVQKARNVAHYKRVGSMFSGLFSTPTVFLASRPFPFCQSS